MSAAIPHILNMLRIPSASGRSDDTHLADIVALGLLEICKEVIKAAVVIVGPVVLDACAPQIAQALQSISLLRQVKCQVGARDFVLICSCIRPNQAVMAGGKENPPEHSAPLAELKFQRRDRHLISVCACSTLHIIHREPRTGDCINSDVFWAKFIHSNHTVEHNSINILFDGVMLVHTNQKHK